MTKDSPAGVSRKVEVGVLRHVDGGGLVCGRLKNGPQSTVSLQDVGYAGLNIARVSLQALRVLRRTRLSFLT